MFDVHKQNKNVFYFVFYLQNVHNVDHPVGRKIIFYGVSQKTNRKKIEKKEKKRQKN